MDPVSSALVNSVLAILTPYAEKTATAFVNAVGDAAYQKAKGLVDALKARWVGKPAAGNLDEFLQDPKASRDVMAAVLHKQLQSDAELRADVQRRVDDMGPDIEVIQTMGSVEDLTGTELGDVKRGRVRVEQNATTAKKVKGVTAKDVG